MSDSGTVGRPSGISLRRVLPEAQFLHSSDIQVKSCARTLEECERNDLFVAMMDADHDGHEDADLAVQKGASAVLGERLLPVSHPQCLVDDSRIAWGQICHALAGDPTQRLNTIAVSGSDGKTTTSHLIASIFDAANRSSGLTSSLTKQPKISKTTVSDVAGTHAIHPPVLAQTAQQWVLDGFDSAILEVGSIDLARRRLTGTHLDIAVITNARGNRYGFHATLNNYRKAQSRVLQYLKRDGVAVLNADDPMTWRLMENQRLPALTFGVHQQADVQGRLIASTLDEQKFVIQAGDESAMIRTSIPGPHHIYNCLAAAATALVSGIDLATIAQGLESVSALPGRMRLVNCGQSFRVVLDEASTPYRLGVALRLLKRSVSGRVFCLISPPESTNVMTPGQMGRVVERFRAIPILTHRTARIDGPPEASEWDYEPIHQLLDGMERPAGAQVIPDRISAIEWALEQARSGDAILVAGRGHHPIASLSGGRWNLTDEEVCQAWLYGQDIPGRKPVNPTYRQPIFPIDQYRVA